LRLRVAPVAGPARKARAALAVPALLALAGLAASGSGTQQPPAGATQPGEALRDERALARILRPPPGLPAVPVPDANPPTTTKIRLGRKLFLDRRLSRSGTMSCAMCHVPEQAFALRDLQTAVGHGGRSLLRNAPGLLNAAYASPFFRDGREPSLDLQPFDVFLNPDEMAAASLGAVVLRIRSLHDYDGRFETAFGGSATVERIGQALGTYVRSLVSGNSAFDRFYYESRPDALSDSARRGLALFLGKAECANCHIVGRDSALFTDHLFHDTGIAWRAARDRRRRRPVRIEVETGVFADVDRSVLESVGEPRPDDLGRYQVTEDPSDAWRFKTPILRNVALTPPYMHDGSLATLRDVVEYYDSGGTAHDGLDPRIRPLGLDEGEIRDLVAFLESLTGDNVEELVADARSETVGNPGSTP
jgi:cytochrome c peroxidase